ncbi:MAG: hypothetical protein AUI10_10290 [Actinobacteria bacterium 13_2_20CM_2_72_6]|nr:MAG: hypothetical protein AUI10_10290 [Actinobacteria bacterium 13_2_20CM_2_72_6]
MFQQDPAAGQEVKQGDSVTYSVCGGPGSVTVPPLLNLDREQAKRALTEKGLKYAENTVDGLVEQKDKVVKAEPTEGTNVAPGSTVTLSISAGNEAKVPNVSGLDEQTARERLSAAGFNQVKVQTNPQPPQGFAGKVISTTPKADSPARLSDTITIQVGAVTPSTPPTSKSPSPTASPPPPGG